MMDMQTTGHKVQTISLREYAAELAGRGVQVLGGGPGTFWTRYQYGGMMRRPTFYVGPPASNEVQEVLWGGPAVVASYLLEPDELHPANAWLYLCADQAYALDKLSPVMRRNVRRGLRELRIEPLTTEQVLAHGSQAFCETRRRLGLGDGIPEAFHQHFASRAQFPEYVYLGAWKDDQLAAFLSMIEVDDWAEHEGTFSMDALRQYRPSDTLLYTALTYYLVEHKCRLVSSGLSSLQAESNIAGLHRFKTKVGFEAQPVHRAFVPHPLLRPLVNRLTLWGMNTALRLRPEDRRLKKASGALASIFGDTHMLEAAAGSTSDE